MPLLDGLKNILYDTDRGVVFVKNKRRYIMGGRPDLNAASIAGDLRHLSGATDIWTAFAEHHASYLQSSEAYYKKKDRTIVWLRDLLAEIDGSGEAGTHEGAGTARTKPINTRKPKGGKKIPTVTEQGFAADVDKWFDMLASDDRLESDDIDLIRRVWVHLTVNLGSSKPISLGKRLTILEKLRKEPPGKIAIAADEFKKNRCFETGKRDNYFFGILRNSATSIYVERMAEERVIAPNSHDEVML